MSAPIELVGIGASAGGFEALSELLPALRVGFPAAVAVVLHLPRDRPSQVAALLAHRTALPVREVEDKDPIEPGTVYVAPPDYHLLVERGGAFALSIDPLVHFSRPSIDVFLDSAARAYGPRMLGIVLTGANEDGAEGLARVKKLGGTTWVQEPRTAQSAIMPSSAIQRARPDRVLSLAEMARALGELSHD